MKQKIGIVQALMGRAPVLILDEPTAGLDPMMVQAFRETLEDLKKDGATTIFSVLARPDGSRSHVRSEWADPRRPDGGDRHD